MRGDKPSVIDVVGPLEAPNEPDRFRIRDGVGKGLGEAAITWKLDNPELVELIRAVILRVIIQARFRCAEHLVQVVGVRRKIINLQSYSIPVIVLNRIVAGDVTEEILNFG